MVGLGRDRPAAVGRLELRLSVKELGSWGLSHASDPLITSNTRCLAGDGAARCSEGGEQGQLMGTLHTGTGEPEKLGDLRWQRSTQAFANTLTMQPLRAPPVSHP